MRRGQIVGTNTWRLSADRLVAPVVFSMQIAGPPSGGVIYVGYECYGVPADLQIGFTVASNASPAPLLTWPIRQIFAPEVVVMLPVDWPPQQDGVLTLGFDPGSDFQVGATIRGLAMLLPPLM